MVERTLKAALPLFLSLCLGLPLAGCKEPVEESSLYALAYADVLDEVTLSLRVERLAYPVLLEELTALQSRLRRETAAWPADRLLTALGLEPGTPGAERALADEAHRLDELEVALERETEDLLVATDSPRPRSSAFDADLRTVAAFTPRERFNALVRDGLDERAELLLTEYDLERRTEGLSWHELVGRLSASLAEYTPLAAAYCRTNREIQRKIEAINSYLDGLGERENPFAAEHPHE
ncbi:MAG TPA: hypothetical protein VM054_08815 [bacterium]|nr:hypothetical protein [bacterium]